MGSKRSFINGPHPPNGPDVFDITVLKDII